MIYIIQFIYINEGREEVFDQFESHVIPIIPKYNGKLLLRIRPDPGSIIEAQMDKPYEIHLVEFASETDFDNFTKDKERKQFFAFEGAVKIKRFTN